MKKHLILLLTLGALLNYRPGNAQARTTGLDESSPTMLVSATRTKPTSARATAEMPASKSARTTSKKEAKPAAKVAQKPVSHFWSKIMGICSEVHTAAKKKS